MDFSIFLLESTENYRLNNFADLKQYSFITSYNYPSVRLKILYIIIYLFSPKIYCDLKRGYYSRTFSIHLFPLTQRQTLN